MHAGPSVPAAVPAGAVRVLRGAGPPRVRGPLAAVPAAAARLPAQRAQLLQDHRAGRAVRRGQAEQGSHQAS